MRLAQWARGARAGRGARPEGAAAILDAAEAESALNERRGGGARKKAAAAATPAHRDTIATSSRGYRDIPAIPRPAGRAWAASRASGERGEGEEGAGSGGGRAGRALRGRGRGWGGSIGDL